MNLFIFSDDLRTQDNKALYEASLDQDGLVALFIIDKERNLRGRDDDEKVGTLFGYNAQSVAEINNKMVDDIKVILAEYRRALKKYNNTDN